MNGIVLKNAAIGMIAVGLLSIFVPNISLARQEIGFFYNDQLQSILQKNRSLAHDGEKYSISLDDFVSSKTKLVPKNGYYSEIENFSYCDEKLNGFEICNLTQPISTKIHQKKGAVVYLHEEKIKQHLEDFSEDIRQEPKDGKLKMTDEGRLKVVRKSIAGKELDIVASSEEIIRHIKEETDKATIPLVVKTIQPEVSTNNIQELGIKELIAHGESNFRGSPSNRIHNIKVATSKFDGHVMKPGEEFSFTTILGPVDGSTGYKEELVIKQNKTIPEFGGGVCQVSTTMFRVALNAGMKITERHNHAYPVQYYAPQGTDATIYLPSPDLKFINNTPAHILIQSSIEGTILSFDFYGTPDGREVEIEGPKVTQRTADGKMRTVLYQIIKDEDGTVLRKDTFKSFYDNPAKYHEPEFTSKPDDWSNKQWDAYRAEHGI